MKRNHLAVLFLLSLYHVAILGAGKAWAQPTPPVQPLTGPGSSSYAHAKVEKAFYGEADHGFWIFKPSAPVPNSAPLIVFNHGWSGTNPKVYGAWIEHIVRRGNIVVYPLYQNPGKWRYPTDQIMPNAIEAVQNAIRILNQNGQIKPDLDKFAIVGHSAGGQITANMTALASQSGLPIPKAVMCVQPGKSWNKFERANIVLADLSKVPASTLLLTVVGDQDRSARDIDAKRIYLETTQVPPSNKNFIVLNSDKHGSPALKASHFAPTAVNSAYDSGEEEGAASEKRNGVLKRLLRQRIESRMEELREGDIDQDMDMKKAQAVGQSVNALDYYGLWKLFDALCDAAFYGKNRDFALGNTPNQKFMGNWSDNTPVAQLSVLDM